MQSISVKENTFWFYQKEGYLYEVFLIVFVLRCPPSLHPGWNSFHYEVCLENINTRTNANSY